MNNHLLKLINRNTFLCLFACVCLLFVVSCKDDETATAVHDPTKPITLTSFFPDSGRISEMIIFDGDNFGSDPSQIRMFFNAKEARVIGSTGKRMMALVPRLPGDTCEISVQIGDLKATFGDNFFRYLIAASVTTLAGNGTTAFSLGEGVLDKATFQPVYIGIDQDFNIFVSVTNDNLLRISEAENTIVVVATGAQGYNHRCMPYTNPVTNVLQMGSESIRDNFVFLDPKTGWVPKIKTITNWITNEFALPSDIVHYHCLYCEEDGYYYTRYNSGQLVKINPDTWEAEIVSMTNSGRTYGAAFHPINKHELWLAYDNNGGEVAHSLCRIDVRDPKNTFEKLTGATNGAYRDPIEASQFRAIRQINFDSDGNLYVGDNGNECIRMVNTNTMMVETIIGIPQNRGFKDGSKDEAQFNQPHGLVVDAEGVIYVSDYGNSRIRRIAIE